MTEVTAKYLCKQNLKQISLICQTGDRFIGVTVRAGVNLTHTKNQPCGSPATAEQSVEGVMVGFMCDPPVKAKYVSLDINARGKLDIAEVTVEEYSADVGNCKFQTCVDTICIVVLKTLDTIGNCRRPVSDFVHLSICIK